MNLHGLSILEEKLSKFIVFFTTDFFGWLKRHWPKTKPDPNNKVLLEIRGYLQDQIQIMRSHRDQTALSVASLKVLEASSERICSCIDLLRSEMGVHFGLTNNLIRETSITMEKWLSDIESDLHIPLSDGTKISLAIVTKQLLSRLDVSLQKLLHSQTRPQTDGTVASTIDELIAVRESLFELDDIINRGTVITRAPNSDFDQRVFLTRFS